MPRVDDLVWKLPAGISKLLFFASRFHHATSGTAIVLFGLAVMPLTLVAGIAIDYERAVTVRKAMQAAADRAAIAAATQTTATLAERQSLAINTLLANLTQSAAANKVTASQIALTQPSPTVVRITASGRTPTTVTRLLRVDGIDVSVVSEASVATGASAPQCVLLLEPTGVGLFANSDAKFVADCGVQVNSSHTTEAIYVNSNAHIAAAWVKVRGGVKMDSGSSIAPAPSFGALPQNDPLDGLPQPTNSANSCDQMDFTVGPLQHRTMTPGVYCGTTVIDSGGVATMEPGVYIFRGGAFVVNSLSSVTGSGVMMYFHDKDAHLNVNSGSTFRVSAPNSGFYAGMLIFQGRDTANSGAPPFIVNSDGNVKLEGTIYLPRGTLKLNSNSDANLSAKYTVIVARDVQLNSSGTMNLRSDFSGPTPIPPLLNGWKHISVARLLK